MYPKGVKRIDQVPWPLQEAINQALIILAWFENYVSEDIPPEPLWDDGEFVEDWFKRVARNKEDERNGYSKPDSDDDSPSDMMGNDLSSVFKD